MKRIIIIAFLALFTCACNDPFMPGYDAQIDHRGNALQNKVNRFLNDLQRTAGTPAAAYENHKRFYSEMRTELKGLRDAAAKLPRNEATLNCIAPIEENVAVLETLHRTGITAAEVPVLRTIFETQFQALLHLEDAKLRGKRKKDVGR
jgi:hypothetical protein